MKIGNSRPVRWAIAALLAIAPFAASHAEDWSAERAKLVAAAENEGEIDLFSQPNLAARNYISAAWAKDFPKSNCRSPRRRARRSSVASASSANRGNIFGT